MNLTPADQELRRLRNRQFAIVGIGYLFMLPTMRWVDLITAEQFVDLFKWVLAAYIAGDIVGLLRKG